MTCAPTPIALPPELLAVRPAPHPLVPPHTEAQAEEWMQLLVQLLADGRREELGRAVDGLLQRRKLLALAEEDPLYHGHVLDCWKLVQQQLDEGAQTVALFGGNRTSKSWLFGKLFCEAALAYPGSTLVALSAKEESSINTQQKIVWHYLRRFIEKFNNKRHPRYKVNYSQANGFTEGKLVLPLPEGATGEGTEIYFLTYKQVATDYEGWEFGARLTGGLKRRADGTAIHNIAAWPDESMSLQWLEVLSRRVPFRKGRILWSFTPVRGITTAIKEFLGAAPRVLQTAEAKLPPVNSRIPGCPAGHMPVVLEPARTSSVKGLTRAVYFHNGSNPFGDYTAEVIRMCEGKDSDYVMNVAYGYARDTARRQFGNFGRHNIITREELPAVGTDYMVADPGIDKPYFFLYVRVAPGLGGRENFYIWRDWPDEQTYGEWALPTDRETSDDTTKGWDGDPGPAQNNLDLGYASYKRIWRDIETVKHESMGGVERDPKRRALQVKLKQPGASVRMDIYDYIIDSRAGMTKSMEDNGQTCPVEKFREEEEDISTGEMMPGVDFRLADGARIDLNLIRELLEVRRDKDGRIEVPPRLYVTEECRQVIWALSNYTSRAGEKGACKDPIDCLRYMASAELYHVEPEKNVIRTRREIARGEN